MQRILVSLSFIILSSTSLFAISLRDSVRITLNNNPSILAERKNQEAFRKYVDEREGLYLPTLDIESYYKAGEENQNADDDSSDGKWISANGYNSGIILRQYLYNGGETPSQVSEVKHQYIANKYKSLNTIENTILNTVKTYISLVQYTERIALSKNMMRINEENLVIAKEKEEISGEVLETYQVSSKLHFVTDQYLEEEVFKDDESAKFKRYVGIEPSGKLCRPAIDKSEIPPTLKDAIEMAVLRNHTILEQIENIKKQREKIAQYDSKFLPTLYLELKASIDDDLELSNNGMVKERFGKLILDWNLFNGNRDRTRSKQEELFLQKEKKKLDDITNDIVSQVKSEYRKIFKNQKRVEALEKYVDSNINILEVYKSEFEAGTRTFVDILNAESELYNSTKSLINMEFQALNNYYDLMLSLSKLSDVVLNNKNQDCAKIKPRVIDYSPKKQNKDTENELEGLISQNDSSIISGEDFKNDMIIDTVNNVDNDLLSALSEDILTVKKSEYKSFLEAPASYYTINISTKRDLEEANKYIKDNDLTSNAYVFKFGESMNSVKILYGVYSSINEAKEAMKNLSPRVLSKKPYVDNINKHQELYAKYN